MYWQHPRYTKSKRSSSFPEPTQEVRQRILRVHPAHRCRWRLRAWRSGRKLHRKPSIPSMRPVLSVKFAIAFDIDVGLHCAEWNDVTKLWPNPNYPGLEATHPVARAAVATDLIVEIADHAN